MISIFVSSRPSATYSLVQVFCRSAIALVTLPLVVSTSVAQIPVYEWVNPGLDGWHFDANWMESVSGESGVPVADSDAWIDNGGTPQVTADAPVHEVHVGRISEGYLDVLGPLGNLNVERLFVGWQGIGAFSVSSGGQANSASAVIGSVSDATGSVSVTGADSTWTNSADLTVGLAGDGSMVVSDSGQVESANAILGHSTDALGSVNVHGLGSQWNSTGTLTVARAGTGTMSITDGGAISSSAGIIGEQDGALGTVTINGPESTWSNDLDLSIGHSSGGNGLLSITDGGRSLANNTYIGVNAGATGVASIEGEAALLKSMENLYVGYGGSGLLSAGSGGQIESGNAYVGWDSGVDGTMTLDGAGSQWTNNGELHIGVSGTGSVTVSAGAKLHGQSEILVNRSAIGNGMLIVAGTDSQVTTGGELRVADEGTGRLQIEGGATVSSGRGVLGNNTSDAVGMALVTGLGSSWSLNGPLLVGRIGQGVLTVAEGGSVIATEEVNVGAMGQIDGDGTIEANVINDGIVAPGALLIDGNYTQSAAGRLHLELASPTSFDKLEITGTATLEGTLEVLLDEDYIPQGEQSFDVLDWSNVSGTFSSVLLPSLGGTLTWDTSELYTSGILSVGGSSLAGDYNGDSLIDAADYTLWRDTLGQVGTDLAADGSGDGIVDQDDYAVWKTGFAAPMSGGAGATVSLKGESVPEPASASLAIFAVAMLLPRRARRSFH